MSRAPTTRVPIPRLPHVWQDGAGVKIVSVHPDGRAAKTGLTAGDTLLSVNGLLCTDHNQAISLLDVGSASSIDFEAAVQDISVVIQSKYDVSSVPQCRAPSSSPHLTALGGATRQVRPVLLSDATWGASIPLRMSRAAGTLLAVASAMDLVGVMSVIAGIALCGERA